MRFILTLASVMLLSCAASAKVKPNIDSASVSSHSQTSSHDSTKIESDATKNIAHDSSWDVPSFIEPIKPLGLDPRLDSIIRPWLGTRHRYGKQSKEGIDCSGFVQLVIQAYLGYKTERSSAAAFKKGQVLDRSDLLPGDVIFFANHHKRIDHSGVWIGGGRFAHASSSFGVEVTELDEDPYWTSHFKGGRRYVYNPAFPPPDPIPEFQDSNTVSDTVRKDVILPPITKVVKNDKHRVSRSSRSLRRKRHTASVRKKHHHSPS